MKILTFNYEYPPLGGGGGVVHELIAEELAARHDVTVITSAFGDLPRSETLGGVEIIRVPVLGRSDRSAASLTSLMSYPPMAWKAAWSVMRSRDFDVVHSHFAVPTGPGSLPPARLSGIPHVLSLHGGDIFDPTRAMSPHRLPIVRSVVSWMMKGSTSVVAQSQNTRENAYRYYSYKGPIEVIPLGIKQPVFPAASRSALGLTEGRFLAISVGRLVGRKGVDELLRCLVEPSCENIDLLVVGSGPDRKSLEVLAHKLGIEHRVTFFGFVADEMKWQLLRCSDAFVSATLHEGFGLVYLEAMAAGLPVITFDDGGQVDFLEDDKTGCLVASGDLPGFTAAMARLQSDPEAAARFGSYNLGQARRHNIEACAQKYEDLFERITAD